MRVIVDMDSNLRPLTGIGWYARMLASQLPEQCEDLDLLYMTGNGLTREPPEPPAVPSMGALRRWARTAGLPEVRQPRITVPILTEWTRRSQRRAQEAFLKPHTDRILHGTNFAVPNFDGPMVATFHDVTILTHPSYHPPVRVKHMTENLRHAARRCQALLTVSEYSRAEIVRHLDVDPARIHVTPLGPRPCFRSRTQSETAETLLQFGLDHKSFVLFCGTIEPRKNIPVLLKAYKSLPASLRAETPLVLAGSAGWKSGDLHSEIRRAGSAGDVRYLGYVSDELLADLFSSASVLVLPSFTEGFGLPVVEAMASDLPVLCSTGGSLPEVAGPQSACFDPEDWQAAGERLGAVLTDRGQREQLVRQGRVRLAPFTWQECARSTIRCYASVWNER